MMQNKINSTGEWKTEPKAEQFLLNILSLAFKACPPAQVFKDRLLEEIAVRMRNLLDHITFADPGLKYELEANGWESEDGKIYRNSKGLFPAFVFETGPQRVFF